ncbi:sensor histidine kinase [Phenylobacterium sp.]|uniref:sensor histidine kinase n=1 Tax=Phenylobacterium sp. TaxID=1871053 RepID=UPI0025DECF70|nr:PAS domain S-box protein [Phenylobacterium sp.]
MSPPSSVFTAIRHAPIGIALFDRGMRYLAASGRFLTDQGLPADTPLVGRLHYDVFPAVPQRWRDLHAQVLKDGKERNHPADPFPQPDGSIMWVRWSLAPWRSDAGEIGGLVLYTEVVTEEVEARMSLEAAEARYRAIFDQVAVGAARVSPDGRFLEVNDRFCEICGYTRAEITQLTFHQITHPDDLDTDVAQAEALLDGRITTYSLEKRYLRKGGGVVWIGLTVSLVRTPTGEPDYFVSIIEDISARKQAEREQQRYQGQLRLLINELNHRVKNTLATVQSMASQTLRHEPDPERAYGKFEARLLGLSEVHELLTRERWHGAALKGVAERALRPFVPVASVQVRVEGPEVWLQPAAALTMALVLHELATNAVKYGALSVERGRIDVTWAFDAASRELSLTWAESQGPPVSPPTRRGFGSRLIERGLRSELRGSATMRYETSGFSCLLKARLPPAENAPTLFDI